MKYFPNTSGQVDLAKYPGMLYLNLTMSDGTERPFICLPVTNDYMNLYSDKSGGVHANINISIDDASALNEWVKVQAAQHGKKHTNFHGQFHLNPSSAAFKRMLEQRAAQLKALSLSNPAEYNALLAKYRLDAASQQAKAEAHRVKPEEVPDTLARMMINNETACGRAYCPYLDKQDVPAPAAAATATVAAAPAYAGGVASPAYAGGITVPASTGGSTAPYNTWGTPANGMPQAGAGMPGGTPTGGGGFGTEDLPF